MVAHFADETSGGSIVPEFNPRVAVQQQGRFCSSPQGATHFNGGHGSCRMRYPYPIRRAAGRSPRFLPELRCASDTTGSTASRARARYLRSPFGRLRAPMRVVQGLYSDPSRRRGQLWTAAAASALHAARLMHPNADQYATIRTDGDGHATETDTPTLRTRRRSLTPRRPGHAR